MKPTIRHYRQDDYWRIRNFLRDVFELNDRREHSWHVARLDHWWWHLVKNCQICDPAEGVTYIWETAQGQMAAVLHPAAMGEAFLHVHPGFRTATLEQEMMAVAEDRLALRGRDGRRRLGIVADVNDSLRRQVLVDRGYVASESFIHRWSRDLDRPLPDVAVAPQYTIRSLGDRTEIPARSWASWRAFHPDEPDEAYEGWDWYLNIQSAPLYRRDLDIVAATTTGEIAAFCTIWFDDATRSGVCVFVGTAPEHQRRGLGKAVMYEGLRRLRHLGGTRAFANAYDPPADALYGSVLGTRILSRPWVKEL